MLLPRDLTLQQGKSSLNMFNFLIKKRKKINEVCAINNNMQGKNEVAGENKAGQERKRNSSTLYVYALE